LQYTQIEAIAAMITKESLSDFLFYLASTNIKQLEQT
jgi:hypothetical protein